jgi:hypothetical protein
MSLNMALSPAAALRSERLPAACGPRAAAASCPTMNAVTLGRRARSARATRVSAAAAVAAAAALLLVGCAACDDREAAVRRVLAAAEAAAEARDVGDAMALVSADYADARGLDRDGLRSVVHGYFALNPSLELVVRVESLDFPDANRARARLQVLSAGREQGGGGGGGFELDLGRFDVDLVEERGDWRLLRADRVAGGPERTDAPGPIGLGLASKGTR